MRMLENEGFAFENYIDIFDGGPTMTARTDQVTSIAGAQHIAVAGIADEGEDALIATGRLADFRCCFGKRSEEHTSELQSLMRISYAVFCLKKKKQRYTKTKYNDYN